MLLSDQVPLFWSLWGQACRKQGWTAGKGFSAVQMTPALVEVASCPPGSSGLNAAATRLLPLADEATAIQALFAARGVQLVPKLIEV
jgi:hypothetical protein